ncbi:MAG: thioredoxin family protein [Flavobacteriales bacterium]
MKLVSVLAAYLALFGLTVISENSLKWETNVELAQKKAIKEAKPYLVYFTGSDWCGPCKSLSKEFFDDSEFNSMASSFILVKLDIPRRIDIISEKEMTYNKEKLSELNPSKKFPTLIAFSKTGKEIDRISGYSGDGDASSYLNFIKVVLEDIPQGSNQ